MKKSFCIPFVCIAVMLLFCAPSHAVINGTVTDAALTPVMGACITLTNESDPDVTFTAYSDKDGYYEIALMPLGVDEDAPQPFQLGQNYPNPFNPVTTIPFSLDEAASVSLVIYNIMGQRIATIADYYMNAGSHSLTWDGMDYNGSHVSAGVYLYNLKAGRFSETRKMLLLDGGPISGSGAGYSSMSPVSKIAESGTYTVNVTHESIIPYEETGVSIDMDGTFDIVVSVVGANPGVEFVDIPGGTFDMGGESEHDFSFTSSVPVHQVTVSGFEMGIYEVTNAQYAAYLNDALESGDITVSGTSVIGTSGDWEDKEYFDLGDLDMEVQDFPPHKCEIKYGNSGFSALAGFENHPVVHVTWYGAKAFANYYGFDLPTDAEWEYAARSGEQFEFATDDGTLEFGDTTKALIMAGLGEDSHSVEVGNYPPTPFGVYDMVGNVYEWCHDWYAVFEGGSETDPTGPDTGTERVLRGSYWALIPDLCCSYFRWVPEPERKCVTIGFRVVRRPGGLTY